MTTNEFKMQLQERFETTIKSPLTKETEKICSNSPIGSGYFEDLVDEYSYEVSNNLTNDSIKVLNGDNWNVPESNLYPLGFAMRRIGVNDFNDLLNVTDPIGTYMDWFWQSLGTFGITYNYSSMLCEQLYYLEEEVA